MKQFTKYICVFLMMAGMSVNAWGKTTSSAVILPAGSTSYTAGDWGDHGAYIGSYPTSAATESMCVSDGNGYDVTFYQAYDAGTSDGLQLRRKADAYVSLTIASSNGIDVEISYKNPDTGDGNGFTLELTGASNKNVAGSASFTTTTISTSSTSATLKINGSNSVLYIKYIKITPKSSGTITIGHDDCVLGPNIVFSTTSISKTVTPAEAESGGSFTSIGVTGINIYGDGDCETNWVQYDFENTSGASGTYGIDWEFSYVASSSSDYYSCPEADGSLDETVTISYAFLSEPDPGDYTADFYALTWDDEYTQFDFRKVTVTLTVEDCIDLSSTHMTLNTVTPTYNTSTSEWDATVSWDAVTGATRYGVRLQYYDTDASKWKNAADWVYTTGTSYTITDLTEDTKYRIGVQGQNTTCSTATAGDITNEFTPHCDKPSTTTVTTSSITSTGVTVSWGSVTGASNYAVMITNEAKDENISGTENETPPSTSHTFTGLTPNTNYYAAVRISNACGKTRDVLSTMFTTLQRYAITYYKNDGGATSNVEYKDHGVDYTISSDKFSRDHYTLSKWHTLAAGTGGTDYAKGATYTSNEALSLYAVWTPKDYTISFNNNGGSGSMSSTDKAYNSSYSLPSCTFTPPSGKVFDHWGAGSAGGTSYDVDDSYTVTGDITFYAVWKDGTPTDLVFSCAELEITGPTGNLVFITSAASKTVRSQEAFHIEGSGLSASQSITFTHSNSTIASKFAYKTSDGTALSTDASGEIDTDFYIYYTPDEGDTDDGLDVFTNLQAKVTEGLKPKASNILSTKTVMGRHLPADFVIAGKKDGKWWAMPSNMASTTNPKPSEIAVDDFNNPSVAYTDASNKYGLAAPTASNISGGNGQYIRLTMSIEDGNDPAGPAPLFGSATGTRTLGKSTNAKATSDLSAGWWWQLKQTSTSITNPQDAKYTIYCANNTSSLSLRDNAGDPDWGLFASGVEELRLIPASDIPFTEAYFIEWGRHGGVIEVDAANAGGTGQAATSVVAHLGEATSSAITLSQTGTSGGKSSKYNYTVNFGDGIDFAASTSNGAMLTLEWKNGETVKAISNIVVPKIIASSATMKSIMSGDAQWETEVHVLPDVTLTANAGDFESNDVMIKQLEIYPGATVVVTKGDAGSGTLKVKTLVLRNGWTCASGTRKYDVARLYITPSTASLAKNAVGDVWYMDWYIDYDQYYPISVPWKVAVNSSNIVHRYTSNTATFGPSGSIRLRYYDGEQRATSGQSMIGQNWKDYGKSGNENLPGYLEPSKGYSFSAKRPSGKAFSIVRMTLGIPSNDWTALGEQGEVSGTHKDQVSVTGWGKGTADWYAMGWNFIGNPYMCTFNGDDAGISGKLELQNGGSIKYATIPSIDFSNYDQVAIADADLKPARGFFIQANNAEAQNITFNASKIVDPTAAPARYMTQTEAIPEQEAYIRLSYEGGKDQMGLIIGEDYTEAYEVNADLAKVLGDAGFVKTYMQYGGMDMAYVAINQELAKAWIPVTVILPKDGEYTFSLMSSSEVEQLEGVYLIDYAENETVTNLIDKDYTFVADAATISNRFAINAIIGERQTPTDIDVINEGGDLNSDRPFKFLYRDKVYIYHCGVIYDATGKRVKEINK